MATRLRETVLNEGLPADAVDEEGGVIKGVALLGRDSKNGRRYSPKAMQDAARLYEGASVNIDHRSKSAPTSERGFMEGGGIIRNASVDQDGSKVRGDFHFLKSHPASALIVESAKRFPASFGFSHDAEGETKPDRNGVLVESIETVHSIDIVRRPATNSGLFESEDDDMSKARSSTVKKILEAATDSPLKSRLSKLVEMDAVAADMPVDAMPAESDPNEDVKAALKKAGAAIVGKMIDGDLDPSEALKKLKELVGMSEKMDAGGDSSSGGGDTPPAVQESIRNLEHRLNVSDAKNLLLESKRAATPERIEAVAMLAPEKRKKLVESWPAEGESKPRGRTGSILESYDHSSGPDSLKEVFGDKGPGYMKHAKAKV